MTLIQKIENEWDKITTDVLSFIPDKELILLREAFNLRRTSRRHLLHQLHKWLLCWNLRFDYWRRFGEFV